MKQYKQEFIEFMILCEVLKFGDFVTKSGRKTPFFTNTGSYHTGTQLKQLGAYYARAIHATFGKEATLLSRPAYKGIPLCVATSIDMSELYRQEVSHVTNRKEIRDHSDKGILLGAPIKDNGKVVIVEDITTAEASVEETMPIIRAQSDTEVLGLVVSVDHCERGRGKKSALSEISERYDIETTAIVMMRRVIEHLYRHEVNGKIIIGGALMERIDTYYRKYDAEED